MLRSVRSNLNICTRTSAAQNKTTCVYRAGWCSASASKLVRFVAEAPSQGGAFAFSERRNVGTSPRLNVEQSGYPPPGCFRKRGCKPLKTKEGSAKKSAKSDKEA